MNNWYKDFGKPISRVYNDYYNYYTNYIIYKYINIEYI